MLSANIKSAENYEYLQTLSSKELRQILGKPARTQSKFGRLWFDAGKPNGSFFGRCFISFVKSIQCPSLQDIRCFEDFRVAKVTAL